MINFAILGFADNEIELVWNVRNSISAAVTKFTNNDQYLSYFNNNWNADASSGQATLRIVSNIFSDRKPNFT